MQPRRSNEANQPEAGGVYKNSGSEVKAESMAPLGLESEGE